MAAEVEGTAHKLPNPTFAGSGLEYNYDAELAAVLPFNVKIPFRWMSELNHNCRRDGSGESYAIPGLLSAISLCQQRMCE